jgi:ABC-type glycerol-3-phosphate transport system permease component
MSERSRRNPSTAKRLTLWVVLLGGAMLMLLPLVWMVLTSLKTFDEVLESPPTWLPRRPAWENYREALSTFDFVRYFANSTVLAVVVIAGTLLSCSLAAYAFARLRSPAASLLFGVLLSTTMLPAQVTVIPLFSWFSALGWVDTYIPLVLPAWLGTNVLAIFLLRQFFVTIPRDYAEAARVDGASELRILFSVYLPLAKPALLTVAVFTFLGSWNDLWGPLLYLQDESKYTLPIALLNFVGLSSQARGSPWHLVMAVSTVMMLPVVVIFFLAQRRFIQGIAASGIKT